MRIRPRRIQALALAAALVLPGLLVSGANPALAAPATAEATAVATPAQGPVESTTAPAAPATPSPTVPAAPATPSPTVPATTPAAPEAPGPTREPTGSVAIGTAPIPAPEAPGRAAAAPYAATSTSDPYLAKVLALINVRRAASAAGPLVWNATIATGSQQWAATLNARLNKDGDLDMSKIHRSDAGLSILPKGADMYSEIIGINYTPENIVDWWMGSPAHRAAMLDKRATDIGIGQVQTTKYGWGGMRIVVANLAGYESSRVNQPQPAPVPVANDGDVAAIDSVGNLFIYGSAKGGDLWQRKFVSSGWAGVQQVEVVDFNSDGLQDIVSVWRNGNLTANYGQSNGTLSGEVRLGTGGWGSYEIAVTKWRTADKHPSILAKNVATGELFHYPSTNGSGLSARTSLGYGWGPLAIVAVDFDGDGRTDIAARDSIGQLLLFRGNGTGNFINEPRKIIGTGWNYMTHLSGINNHLGTKAGGILARTNAGNLRHYPILKGAFGSWAQIGTGGWQTLLLGS